MSEMYLCPADCFCSDQVTWWAMMLAIVQRMLLGSFKYWDWAVSVIEYFGFLFRLKGDSRCRMKYALQAVWSRLGSYAAGLQLARMARCSCNSWREAERSIIWGSWGIRHLTADLLYNLRRGRLALSQGICPLSLSISLGSCSVGGTCSPLPKTVGFARLLLRRQHKGQLWASPTKLSDVSLKIAPYMETR